MAINDAMRLLKMVDTHPEFRKSLVRCNKLSEMEEVLKTNDMSFTPFEFEEAINLLHVQCQTLEAAQSLMAKAEWYNYMKFTMVDDING